MPFFNQLNCTLLTHLSIFNNGFNNKVQNLKSVTSAINIFINQYVQILQERLVIKHSR